MKNHLRTLAPTLMILFFVTVGAPKANAQITTALQAHINHSFVIGEKTLPPGDYTFRMETDSNLGLMTVQNKNGDNVAQFNVRRSIANPTPKHAEIVFRKYGDTEFLSKVYEGGSKNGVSVTETAKEEARFVNEGKHPQEHAEEQP
jgi:hypothetical protein